MSEMVSHDSAYDGRVPLPYMHIAWPIHDGIMHLQMECFDENEEPPKYVCYTATVVDTRENMQRLLTCVEDMRRALIQALKERCEH